MKNVSTLIYFVNKMQPEQKSVIRRRSSIKYALEKAEDAKMEPSDGTINAILGFAKSYEVIETDKNGPIEMNLN